MANSKTTSDFVSDRANLIQASITMTITALANQLRKEGKDVIGMSAGILAAPKVEALLIPRQVEPQD